MRKVIVILLLVILFVNNSLGQEYQEDSIKTFDIKKFEENKGKQGYLNEYHYKLNDGTEIREYSHQTASNNYELKYQREISKEFIPIKFTYLYYNNGFLNAEVKEFNNSDLEIKEYDKNNTIIKEINFDKDFKYSFEDIRELLMKMKNVDIYDTRQAVALRHSNPNAVIKKYYQIHVIKSNLIDGKWYSSPDYSLIIDDANGKEWSPEQHAESKSYYKTYQGKDYTKEEWEAFEEEYKKHHKKKNIKGFWDDIFNRPEKSNIVNE